MNLGHKYRLTGTHGYKWVLMGINGYKWVQMSISYKIKFTSETEWGYKHPWGGIEVIRAHWGYKTSLRLGYMEVIEVICQPLWL